MPIGAGIMAAGSAVGGIANAVGASSAANTQAKAATQAAQVQAEAANKAAQMQLGEFNTINSQLAPYRNVGTAALPIYSSLLGITPQATAAAAQPDFAAYVQNNPDVLAAYNNQANSPNAMSMSQFGQQHWTTNGKDEADSGNPNRVYTPYGPASAYSSASGSGGSTTPDYGSIESALAATPGYQFTQQQGMQQVNNALTARGLGGLSGSLGKGLARFVTGLADNTYQQQLGNYGQAVGVGQSAAGQTGQFGTAATNNAASSLIGGANASAAGTIGAANANAAGTLGVAQGLGGIGSGASNAYLSSQLLGMYGGGGNAAGNSFATNFANAPEFY